MTTPRHAARRTLARIVAVVAVVMAAMVPMTSAQATPIWTSSQWVRGHVAVDYWTYCSGPLNCFPYTLRQVEVDYRSASGPASVGSGAVTRYELRARGHAAGSNVWSAWQPSPTTWGSVGKALAYSDSGAILGATYQFQIRAVNGSGAGPAASLVYVQAT